MHETAALHIEWKEWRRPESIADTPPGRSAADWAHASLVMDVTRRRQFRSPLAYDRNARTNTLLLR